MMAVKKGRIVYQSISNTMLQNNIASMLAHQKSRCTYLLGIGRYSWLVVKYSGVGSISLMAVLFINRALT